MITLAGFGDEISKDLTEQLDVLESEGIKCLDFRGIEDKGCLSFTLDEYQEIKKKIDEREFKISCVASPIGKIFITEDFEKHLQDFKKSIEIAHIFETPYIRIFSYYIPKGENPEKYRSDVMERLFKHVEIAEKEKVILLLENEHGIYGDTSDRNLDILKTINSKYLKALFDPGNYVVEKEKPFTDSLPKVINYIEYLHIKDGKWLPSGEVQFFPAGEGDSQIKEIFIELKKRNFKGTVSLEPHLQVALSTKGFTGAELFKQASKALKKILKEVGFYEG